MDIKRKDTEMKNHHNQERQINAWCRYFFIISLTCLLLIAGPAVFAKEQKDGDHVPKKGLESGLQQGQEPATPQRQCPQGMKWSDREGTCVSDIKTSTQTGGGGGGNKREHKTFDSPGGQSGR
jgi:hypothetical protein